jgi:DNA-binding beta-propeller fold protein YncE
MKNLFFVFAFLLSLIVFNATSQNPYTHDRVFTANQVSNTISVVNPSTNEYLGEMILGRPYPDVLSPLYKGQALVHGLRYSADLKMLAVVSIGSNSLTLISTETNHILKTIYIGRSPHEPTFTPDNKQIWVSVRGEAYISVIDVNLMIEIKRVSVADGPGMVAFTPDGKLAYICSSFTPEVDVVSTATYEIIKRIPVISPFSPNIFTSPKGEWIALTHKDVGKVTILNTSNMSVYKVISTGAITNHVTFCYVKNKLLMIVTVGGENKIRVFDVASDFEQINTISVGGLPHGIWSSADGKRMYIGLEYGDMVQGINLETMTASNPVQIGQSPQALVYADNAVSDPNNHEGLVPLNDKTITQIVNLTGVGRVGSSIGRLAIRSIGLTDLIEQIFTGLKPNTSYTLGLTRSDKMPYHPDYELNSFITDGTGKYLGQSTGLIKSIGGTDDNSSYDHIFLFEKGTGTVIFSDIFP